MISKLEWMYWTRGAEAAEREFGLKRGVSKGYDGLSEIWTGVDEYAAIFDRAQLEAQEYDTIAMDVDAHAEGESWEEKARQILGKVEIQPSRMYITGRGGHLYWDLDTPIKGTGRYKQVVGAMVKKWGIGGLVDAHVVGDVRRVMRLPGSKNSKGGMCIRVSVNEIGWAGYQNWKPDTDTLINEVPRKISLVIGEVQSASEQHFAVASEARRLYEEGNYPPCIRAGIKQMQQTGELDHQQRLLVFGFLVKNDEMEKAWNILKMYAGDFNAGISRYQLDYLASRNMNLAKCTNVPRDLCPYTNQRECGFFPSINLHRRTLMESGK